MLDSTKVINGSFCKVYHNGEWLTNATGLELQVEVNYEDVPRAGTRKVGKKATSIDMSGTLSGTKINHNFVKAISQIMDDSQGAFVTELLAEVNDPEATDAKAFIRVKGVQFNTIPVLNFEHGSIVEEELPFVFDDYEFL